MPCWRRGTGRRGRSALKDYASSVVSGQRPQDPPDGRRTGAAADTATPCCLAGQRVEVQPVELHLVVVDRSLLGGDRNRSVSEPAR